MKKVFLFAAAVLVSSLFATPSLRAQSAEADKIIGTYHSIQDGDEYKVKVTKLANGTYQGQIFWVKDRLDENGNVYLDEKNPDKSLRKTPCDQIVVMTGMTYDASDKKWTGGKIYDPQRGLKANCKAWFEGPSTLKVRGTLLGIGETVEWKKL